MKHRVLLLMVAVVLCAGTILIVMRDASCSADPSVPTTKSDVKNSESPAHSWPTPATVSEVVDFPPVEKIVQKDQDRYLGFTGEIRAGVFQDSRWYDSKTKTKFVGWVRVPVGTPAVKFRLMKPDRSGGLVPCPGRNMEFEPVLGGAPKDPRYQEFFMGILTHLYWDPEQHLLEGTSLVAPLWEEYDTDNPGQMALIMGVSYWVEVSYKDNGWQRGRQLVKMPDHVPPGKMAVIDIDVTKKQDEWWKKSHPTKLNV
ncbi:MAG: hypothetical protein KGZ25_14840, partial [Planctomycetes bacterium]|nr:hypothetical protein [Planctomycetota bacterium]